MKKYLLLLLLLSFYQVQAQTRNELWTKLNITKSINKHFGVGVDVQHRRQNGFENGYNMLQYGMTNSIRLWANYKLKHNWSLVLSPIAYFDNQAIKPALKEIHGSNELRTMLGITKGIAFGNLTNKNRLLYELSSMQTKEPQRKIRQRYRLQNAFIFPLNNYKNNTSINYFATNEILIKRINNNTTLDQNRLLNGIQWKWHQTDVNIGYQWTLQKEENNYSNKNQLLIFLNHNL